MNIHEYQAKSLLRDHGAPVSDGRRRHPRGGCQDAPQASSTVRSGSSRRRSTRADAAREAFKEADAAKRAVCA